MASQLIGILVLGIALLFGSVSSAQTSTEASSSASTDAAHAFDFDLGSWQTHSSRLLHPLSGSKKWADMDGLTVVKKVWDGRANLAEYKADGPAGHIELLSLRWYNPTARQWNLGFATPSSGKLSVPCVGEFRNGRGEFYDQEDFNGRSILVRFSIWKISSDTAQSEQAFSDDGGKTWEVNWINKYKKVSDQTDIDWSSSISAEPASHDFDFNFGRWHTEIKRTLDPFTDPSQTMALLGTVTVRKVWGGRAQLEEIEADGPKGHWEGLTLFLFDPKAKQWNQIFLGAKDGTITSPLIGDFKDGRGELYQQDTFKDRSILVRGVWSDITPEAHRYEESFSEDGGRTWKTAFQGNLTREKPAI